MTTAPCTACKATPTGIEGHDGLVRRYLEPSELLAGAPPVIFRCTHCSASWSRSYVGDGVFLWHPIDARNTALREG